MKELDVGGLFVSPLLGQGVLALLLLLVLRRVFARVGLYRRIWHRNLFDLSLFVILLWGFWELSR